MNSRSRDAAYWRRRIERDHPEIAERLRKGEITSVRAAAIEAGLIHEPSPLLELRRAWRKASAADRAAFMADVAVRELAQQPFAVQHQRRERVVHGDAAGGAGSLALPLDLPKQALRSAPNVTPIARLAPKQAGAERPIPSEFSPALRTALPAKPGATALPTSNEQRRSDSPTQPPASAGMPQAKAKSGVRRLWGLVSPSNSQVETDKSEDGASGDSGVKAGDRFYKVDAEPVAWEVLAVSAGPHGVLHARIATAEEPDTIRTVSIAALTDPNRYQRIR
jgi:hypothetical protein